MTTTVGSKLDGQDKCQCHVFLLECRLSAISLGRSRKDAAENAMLATPLGIATNVGFGFATEGLKGTERDYFMLYYIEKQLYN